MLLSVGPTLPALLRPSDNRRIETCRTCVDACFLMEGVAMPLTIPDSLLEQAGWTEQDARLEIACRLFQTRRLRLGQAAQWAGLSRPEMEVELLRRGIALYEVTKEQVDAELAAMDRLGIPG